MRRLLRFRFDRGFAFAGALIVLTTGLIAGVINENIVSSQKLRGLDILAGTLAQSVAAPLMFSDASAAQEGATALAANPEVDAVGVYSGQGDLIASFKRDAASDLPNHPDVRAAAYRGAFLDTVQTVERDRQHYGAVYVRLRREPGWSRVARYAPLGLLVLMTALVLAVTGAAQGALAQRAQALAEANGQLQAEMAERKKAQAALVHAQKMEAIGQLTGGVAHDFNNLLMVISGGVRLLEKGNANEEKRTMILTSMSQAVERGAGLTKQLLAFSRRQRLSPEIVTLQERIENLRPLLERSLRENISVKFDFEEPESVVKIDPGQFDLALLNLAVNARDAMPNGGLLSIRVAPSADAESVEISVIDTGQGMAPEVQARAFDPFFTTKDIGRGTGLGLSQVYGFALQSGGRCEIESEVGRGSLVRLVLPRSTETAAPRAEVAPRAAAGVGAVLVVEDDDGVASVVCEMLGDLGYTPTRVPNASEALAQIEGGARPDIIFSDIIMPGELSGIDLANEVRRRRPDLPILLTTGYGGGTDLSGHTFPVLRKPYDRDELGVALARVARG